MNPFIVLIVGIAISVTVIPLAWRLAPFLGMIDVPDPRKVHTVAVPRIGGWGIVFGTLIPIALLMPSDPLILSFVVGGVTLFLFGAWDDAKEIGHFPKFGSQIFAACLVVYVGDLWIMWPPYAGIDAVAPEFGKPFTVFAMVGMMNAINHSDGLDGLAGGESMLSLIVIAFLAYVGDGGMVAVTIAGATMGGVLGFLRYNTHPAQVFMGDTGSQFLGFTLSFLAIYVTQVCHPALSSALPLLMLGLPIIDILAVLYLRIRNKMNWFKATRNHIHHRLLDRGFSHYEAVIIIYSVQAVMVISAIFLRYEGDWWVTAWYLILCAAVFLLLSIAEKNEWIAHQSSGTSRVDQLVTYLKSNGVLSSVPTYIVAALVPLFLFCVPFWVTVIPRDFGIISGVVFIVLALDMIFGKNGISPISKVAVSVAAIFAAYLAVMYSRSSLEHIERAQMAYFALLAAAIACSVRFASQKNFRVTPTDYLIVFGLLTVAFFSVEDFVARDTSLILIEAVVLLYGVQLLFDRSVRRWTVLNMASVAALGTMAVRGVL